MVLRLSLLSLLLGMTGSTVANASDKVLLGCPNITSVAAALSKLEKSDQRDISLSKVDALWPYKLDALDCEPTACNSVWHQGRIINGDCECCATFYFDKNLIKDEGSGSLFALIINYSSRKQAGVVEAAKLLCAVFGVSKQDIKVIGNVSRQFFSTETTRKQQRVGTGIHLTIVQRKRLWEMNLYVGRFVKDY